MPATQTLDIEIRKFFGFGKKQFKMIVANVVPRPPRTEIVKQKRPKKARNPLHGRSTQTGFDTFWKRRLRRTALRPATCVGLGNEDAHCADGIRHTSSLPLSQSDLTVD